MLHPSNKVIFNDCETVSIYPTFAELPPDGKAAFERKFKRQLADRYKPGGWFGPSWSKILEKAYQDNAPLMAEFSQICSIGIFNSFYDPRYYEEGKPAHFRKAMINRDLTLGKDYQTEKELLQAFANSLDKYDSPEWQLCAHNGKQFDFPFYSRRMLINGITLPRCLNNWNKKPWEVPLMDTIELWKFTELKAYTSLVTMCFAFNVPSSKTDIDGSQVGDAFRAGKYEKIGRYCLADTVACANIYYRICGEPIYVEQA